MAKLKDIVVHIVPVIDAKKADAEAKKFGDGIKKALSGAKMMAAGAKQVGKAGKKGLALLDAIQSRLMASYNTVKDMAGLAEEIAQTAFSLGTSEERLIGLERAFGQAGLGNKEHLYSALQSFQAAVSDGLIDIGQRELSDAFMDYLSDLKNMSDDQRNALLVEHGFGSNNYGMHQLVHHQEQALVHYGSDAVQVKNHTTAMAVAKKTNNQLNYIESETSRQLFTQTYLNEQLVADLLAAGLAQSTIELADGLRYKEGNFVNGIKLNSTVEQIQDFLPNTLESLISALTAKEPNSYKLFGRNLPDIVNRILFVLESLLKEVQTTAGKIVNNYQPTYASDNAGEI